MARKDRDNPKKNRKNNISQTDLPDIKTNAQTSSKGPSMKQKNGGR
ncbi:MAG: hypothetical protein PHF89_04585 [Eubacteriales bacterium]|jgi:hypothetical protein|nr:hypothetical protein [Eubacteriales bacterium]